MPLFEELAIRLPDQEIVEFANALSDKACELAARPSVRPVHATAKPKQCCGGCACNS